MRDMTSKQHYSDEELLKIDPELQATFDKRGWPKIRMPKRNEVAFARKGYDKACQSFSKSPYARAALGEAFQTPTWTEQDQNIEVRAGRTIKVRVYVPKQAPKDGAPLVVNMHGGGWFMGSLETDSFICRFYCAKLNVCVIDIDFGLYPEVNFPVPILDCYDAVKWVAANASSFGGNLTKGFVLSGNSGGSCYAGVVAHLARDDNLKPPVTGCHFSCPIFSDHYLDDENKIRTLFDQNTEYRSWWQNADAPLMDEKMRRAIEGLADFDLRSPLISPLLFPSHADMPPTYICVCGLDPLRDGGIIYARQLEKQGGVAKVKVYPGLPHCWWTTYPQLSKSRNYLQDSLSGMEWVLQQNQISKSIKL